MIEIDHMMFHGQHIFCITRQDHIELDFNHGQDLFTASNEFKLQSVDCPEVPYEYSDRLLLYVRGRRSECDNFVLRAPSEQWFNSMLVAIMEYNAMFKGDSGLLQMRLPKE